jgi:hypothetical protein
MAEAVEQPAGTAQAVTAEQLLEMRGAQLDQLFRASPAGPIPVGRGRGTVVAFPGTGAARPAARLGALAWRGKVFRPQSGDLLNLLTPLQVQAIRARVEHGASWVDGGQCVVLDYSQTSRVAGWIRDEIREVGAGVYLGVVWGVGRAFGGRRRLLYFALTFPPR